MVTLVFYTEMEVTMKIFQEMELLFTFKPFQKEANHLTFDAAKTNLSFTSHMAYPTYLSKQP
jgi:hypothetical protein